MYRKAMDLRVESIDAIWIGLHRVGHLVISIRHTRSRRERRPGRSHCLGPLPWGVLMASTPSAYPQVVLRTFASFRVVKPSVSAAHPFYAPGSIPGSSTEKVLVRATSSGQFSFLIYVFCYPAAKSRTSPRPERSYSGRSAIG